MGEGGFVKILHSCGCEDVVTGCYVADETSAAGDRYMRWEIKAERALRLAVMYAPTLIPQVPAVRN